MRFVAFSKRVVFLFVEPSSKRPNNDPESFFDLPVASTSSDPLVQCIIRPHWHQSREKVHREPQTHAFAQYLNGGKRRSSIISDQAYDSRVSSRRIHEQMF
jgi:hypothetical protein